MAGPDPGATAQPISFQRQRFPTDAIRPAVWLYFRFTLSIRYVEELMLQRGVEVSREATFCWVNKFGPIIASNLRRRLSLPTGRWHLDEMVVNTAGRRMYLWRAVEDEGKVLCVLIHKRRNAVAAVKFLRTLLKNQGVAPEIITTDGLAFYRAAVTELGMEGRHRPGGMRENNRGKTRTSGSGAAS